MRSFLIGPPNVAPNWLRFRGGTDWAKKLRAWIFSFRRYSYALPWNWFEPLFRAALITEGRGYSALIPPASTLNSSSASVEGVIEVAPSSYSVMSKPSRNQPPFRRPLPLIRRFTRDARIPWPPELMSEPPGV